MLRSDDGARMTLRAGRRDAFAFTAEARLLAALGRATYAFMCLRWEGLWLHGALTGERDDDAGRRLARADASVVALRLQTVAAQAPVAGRLRGELTAWVDGYAACADVHADILRSHPGRDGLWSLPTDTPERLQLADRPDDLYAHAHRFEQLALEGATLRRALAGRARIAPVHAAR